MELNYDQIAEQLDKAAFDAKATTQISQIQELNIDESYAVQSILMSRRYLRNESLIGLKLGFTSRAKMEQMGVHDMIWGRLTDKMEIEKNGACHFSSFIHPRAEPEIAFRFSKDITQAIDYGDISEYIDGMAVAIEVIDSRYANFKFSLTDVIADNCSSSGFCIGEWQDINQDVKNLDISLEIDGKKIHKGSTNAILGDPKESIVHAVRLALQYGVEIKKGFILLAGAATAAEFLKEGQEVKAVCEPLGEVSFKIN